MNDLPITKQCPVENCACPCHAQDILSAAGLTIDLLKREVMFEGKEVYLTVRQFDIALYLVKNASKVCSSGEIYRACIDILGDDRPNLIAVHVAGIRQKLPGFPLVTVRGLGYKIKA